MDIRLVAAAQNGDVNELRNLMAGNPFLLMPAKLTGGENPLHIACMCGHLDFVKELLFHKPEFAEELNTVGMSPMHIASAYGYLDIVKELIKVGPHLCYLRAVDTKTALHYAAVRGQIQIIDELIKARKYSIVQLTDEGETCLHMAVKHNQVEALQHLTPHVRSLSSPRAMFVLNKGNKQGNTILHLAASRMQDEFIDHLLQTMKPYLELNVVNKQGLTALDIVEEAGCIDTLEKFIQAGAKHAADSSIFLRGMFDIEKNIRMLCTPFITNESRDALLVVAVLIAAATFQAMINPPGGVWQDTVVLGNNSTLGSNSTAYYKDHPSKVASTALPHVAGTSILATLYPKKFSVFLFANTLAFMTSCFMSIFLIKRPHNFLITTALFLMMTTYAVSADGVASQIWVTATVFFPIFTFLILFGTSMLLPGIRLYLYCTIRNILPWIKTCIQRY